MKTSFAMNGDWNTFGIMSPTIQPNGGRINYIPIIHPFGKEGDWLKLVQEGSSRYALFHNFTLLSDENNNLLRVAGVLKRLTVEVDG